MKNAVRSSALDVEQQLQEFADRHTRTEIRPQCFVQDGSVPDLILSLAEAQAVNLIVMGTHGMRGIDRLMLGSVTEKVLRRAPVSGLSGTKACTSCHNLRAGSGASPPQKDTSLYGFFRPCSSRLEVRALDGQGVRR